MPKQPWITRRRVGRGFHYFDGEVRITDRNRLDYYKSLAIPPAWQNVLIAPSQRAHIQATGIDAAGRKQYIYHPAFRQQQETAKFERTVRFAKALPNMRRITDKHLAHRTLDREKVLACIVRLMDEAYFRVGNEVYRRQNESYGITTLRRKHTTVQGATIMFDYIGKSGQHQIKRVTNRRLATIVRQLDELPGYEVFKYYDEDGVLTQVKSTDVNEYIKEIMGEEFSAKDFRTWGGTLLAAAALAQTEPSDNPRQRKKAVTACIKRVARKLGNTPSVVRSSYVDPRIIEHYLRAGELSELRHAILNVKDQATLRPDEQCVLKLLEA
jgi:DNA topoisomerase-1